MKKKIFWHHPRIMNYRLPFFKKLEDIYEIHFFVNRSNIYDKDFKYLKLTTKSQMKYKGFFAITYDDFSYMKKQIKESDIVISSFATSFYSVVLSLLSYIYKKPIITWEEGRSYPNNFFQKLKWIYLKFVLQIPNAIFTLSQLHKDTFIKMGINSKKIFVANEYPAFNYGVIKSNKIDLPFSSNKKIIFYIGRVIEIKGINYLIQAFEMLQQESEDFVLLIVGDGDQKDKLKEYVQQKNIKDVYFLDAIYDDYVKSYLFLNSYVGVVPSIKMKTGQSEGGPLVVLEMLSAGLPVIGSNSLGSSNQFIVDGVTGYTFKEANVVDLFVSIKKIENDLNSKRITKKSIMDYFSSIPNHNFQVEILNCAISMLLKNKNL